MTFIILCKYSPQLSLQVQDDLTLWIYCEDEQPTDASGNSDKLGKYCKLHLMCRQATVVMQEEVVLPPDVLAFSSVKFQSKHRARHYIKLLLASSVLSIITNTSWCWAHRAHYKMRYKLLSLDRDPTIYLLQWIWIKGPNFKNFIPWNSPRQWVMIMNQPWRSFRIVPTLVRAGSWSSSPRVALIVR